LARHRSSHQTSDDQSARTFSLADSGTGSTANGRANRTTHDSTGNGTRGGLLFDGAPASSGRDSDRGDGEGQGKAFHGVSSRNMVKPERQPAQQVPVKRPAAVWLVKNGKTICLKTMSAGKFNACHFPQPQ
jgi:hypothetical protein